MRRGVAAGGGAVRWSTTGEPLRDGCREEVRDVGEAKEGNEVVGHGEEEGLVVWKAGRSEVR